MNTAPRAYRLPRRDLRVSAVAALCAILFLACGRGDFEAGVGLYREGKAAEAVAVLERALLDYSMEEKYSAPFPRRGEGFLYRPRKKSFKVVFPKEFTIKSPSDPDCASYSAAYKRLALARGAQILVYLNGGREIESRECAPDGKGRVQGLGWSDDTLLYHFGKRLYRCSIDMEECAPVAGDESFPPPFSGDNYGVRLSGENGRVIIIAGAAGQYNLSGIDTGRGEPVFKNRRAASSRMLLHEKRIYYISGSSGAWSLCRLSWDGKDRTEIASFDSLVEIELFPQGILYEDGRGVCVREYAGKTLRLPFSYALHGGIGEYGLIEHRKALYVVEARRFFEAINRLRGLIPELFEGKGSG